MKHTYEVRDTHKYGRGVFATRTIKSGELLEQAPILFMPNQQWSDLEKTTIYDYCFYWGEDYAIALGVGSLINHSYTPNARYIPNFEQNTMDFIAIKDIRKEEEISVNYNGSPDDLSPIWFEVQ